MTYDDVIDVITQKSQLKYEIKLNSQQTKKT